MKVGLISDAHANALGLQAALDSLRLAGAVEILFAGDAIGYGRSVNETIDLLRSAGAHAVKGNHEAMLLEEISVDVEARAQYALDYTAQVIRSDNRGWLEGLPSSLELTLDGTQFSVFHGSPWNPLTEYIYPDDARFERFADRAPGIVVLGHTHRQLIREVGRVVVVNPGSCGLSRDGDVRASYALVDTATGAIVHERASYNCGALTDSPRPTDT